MLIVKLKLDVSLHSQLDRWYGKYAHLRGTTKPYKTGFLDFYEKHLPETIVLFRDQTRTVEQYYRTKVRIVKVFDLTHSLFCVYPG